MLASRSLKTHSHATETPAIIERHNMKIQIAELPNHGDARGFSFSPPAQALDFVGRIVDIHLASTAPGAIRGNHYHLHKQEAIIVFPGPAWSLHWDEGEDEGETTAAQNHSFTGSTAVLVLVSPGCSHAVRNDGTSLLWLVTCSSELYDPATVVARKVV